MNWLKDFKELHQNQIYSIVKIEWWLLKYSEEYKYTYEFARTQHCTEQTDKLPIRLPSFGESNTENTFLDLYCALDEISKFHRNEKYFEQEVIDYREIRYSTIGLNNWLAKNELLGADRYVSFITDYLDYDENDDEEHLNVYVSALKEHDIFVHRTDFKNTIEFLEFFNQSYWVNENTPLL